MLALLESQITSSKARNLRLRNILGHIVLLLTEHLDIIIITIIVILPFCRDMLIFDLDTDIVMSPSRIAPSKAETEKSCKCMLCIYTK